MITALLSLVLALPPGTSAADDKPMSYPRGDLLLEPAELARPATAARFHVLDARGKGKYLEGHVPGAVWLDQTTWTRAFKDGDDAAGWARRVGAVGITADSPVVIYDEAVTPTACRMWWVLRYWGVRDVRVLNGGCRGWLAAGGKVEKRANRPEPVAARLRPQRRRLATRAQVLEGMKGKPQILDARSAGEFCGTAETAKRNGAIPGAAHLEWSELVDRKTGRIKGPGELARLFKKAGIDSVRPVTTYCQSGGRASVAALALELMGGKDVRNYYRGWSEWGNAEDTPVVKPGPAK